MNDTRKMHKIELKPSNALTLKSERKASFNKAQNCVHKIFNGDIKEGEVNVINNEGHHHFIPACVVSVAVAVAVVWQR